ncbi:MAG: oligosaccharide flippase family protein [Planctomycetales bacterium]|nr:oligosaccharide flippase family protein [Planctomycetales bacterium]
MGTTGSGTPAPRRSLARRIASGAVWTVVGRFASVGALLGINSVLRRALSEGDYAAYALASAAAIFLGIPASMGVPRILLRTLRAPSVVNDAVLRRRAIANAFSLLPIGCIGCTLLILAFALEGSAATRWQALHDHPLLTSLWMSGLVVSLTLSHALQGFDRFFEASFVGNRSGGVIANVLSLAICVGLWMAGAISLTTALAAQAIANLTAAAIGAMVLWRIAGRTDRNDALPNAPQLDEATTAIEPDPTRRWFFFESLPNVLVQLTSTGIIHFEMLIMGFLANEENVADYNLVLRLAELLAASHMLATTIATPFIAELYARRELRRLEGLLRGVASLVAVPTTVFALAYLAFPEQVLTFFFGQFGDSAVVPLRITTVAAAISCYAGANALTLVMTGNQIVLLRASLTAAGCYLLTAPPLIALYGATGAAIATLAVFGTYNILITLMVRWKVGVWTTPTADPKMWIAVAGLIRKRLSGRAGPPSISPSIDGPVDLSD